MQKCDISESNRSLISRRQAVRRMAGGVVSAALAPIMSNRAYGDAYQDASQHTLYLAGVCATRLYGRILERHCKAQEEEGWVEPIAGRKMNIRQAVQIFALSPEHTMSFVTGKSPEVAVTSFYNHLLARPPDPPGLAAWVKVLNNLGQKAVVDGMTSSPEYNMWFGDWAVPDRPVQATFHWEARPVPPPPPPVRHGYLWRWGGGTTDYAGTVTVTNLSVNPPTSDTEPINPNSPTVDVARAAWTACTKIGLPAAMEGDGLRIFVTSPTVQIVAVNIGLPQTSVRF